MAVYTSGIDSQITELLRSRGHVLPYNLAGIPDEEGIELLQHYLELHPEETTLIFDGSELRLAPAAPPAQPQIAGVGSRPQASGLSPVDQVLQAPVGKSMLDTKAAGGHVSRWWWTLPLSFLVLGGVIAWWFNRERNPTVAWALLITGIVMTIITVATLGPSSALLKGLVSTMSP
ncbi:MAG: hypothetical protein CVT67_08985 [Actinobacteria bacterium HGW-Actinobacteria-7]|nr:MAG: hypothetical protein CVT67_08985 [Actinobacteria bacterium HGW-Actinobacteria-7]